MREESFFICSVDGEANRGDAELLLYAQAKQRAHDRGWRNYSCSEPYRFKGATASYMFWKMVVVKEEVI